MGVLENVTAVLQCMVHKFFRIQEETSTKKISRVYTNFHTWLIMQKPSLFCSCPLWHTKNHIIEEFRLIFEIEMNIINLYLRHNTVTVTYILLNSESTCALQLSVLSLVSCLPLDFLCCLGKIMPFFSLSSSGDSFLIS